ncbi:MAG: phage protease [Limisphaerales bacterium]
MINDAQIKTFKISNNALKGAALPTRLKILGWRVNETIDGAYSVGAKTITDLSANQKRLGFERVAIDFNHSTVPGTDTNEQFAKAGHPPLIFGYGRVNALPGDGIWLEEITWTPLGVQHARNFEDLSPALKDDNREIIMIHSVALTPNGKVEGLQFFSSAMQQICAVDTVALWNNKGATGQPKTFSAPIEK